MVSGKIATQGGEGGASKETISLERLANLIRVVSGDHALEVTTKIDPITRLRLMASGKDPDDTWYMQTEVDPMTKEVKKRHVRVPEKVTKDEDSARGIAAHEAGHVAISRMAEFVPDDVARSLGFSMVMNAAEELATDEVVRSRFPGAGMWLDGARKAEASGADHAEIATENLGRAPKSAQLTNLIVYGDHLEDLSLYDPDVIEAYRAIRPDLKLIERGIPKEGAAETEVIEAAKYRYAVTYKKIWPLVEKFMSEDLDRETIEQLLNDAARDKSGKMKEQISESIPPELRAELERELKERAQKKSKKGKKKEDEAEKEKRKQEDQDRDEKGDQREPGEGSDGDEQPADETGEGEQKQSGQDPAESESGSEGESAQEGEPGGTEGQNSSSGQANGSSGKEDAEAQESEGGSGSGTEEGEQEGVSGGRSENDQLSPELLDALAKSLETMTPEEREKLMEEARRALEDLEDEINKSMQSKLAEDENLETHEEQRENGSGGQGAQKTTDKQGQGRIDKERDQVEGAVSQFESTPYDRLYREMRALDERLYKELDEVLHPNRRKRSQLKSSGSRINLRAVFRREADKAAGAREPESKIFENIKLPEARDYAFSIVVDHSGSMSGIKMDQTTRALIVVSEVLNRLKIPFEIIGYGDRAYEIKPIGKELDDSIRDAIIRNASAGGGTYTNRALDLAEQSLAAQSAEEKFILAMTDGSPSTPTETAESIKRIGSRGMKLVGLGLGPGTSAVVDYFKAAIPEISVEEFPEVLGELMKDIIVNPGKYSV